MKKIISIFLVLSITVVSFGVFVNAYEGSFAPTPQIAEPVETSEPTEIPEFDIRDTVTVYEYPDIVMVPQGEYAHPVTIDGVIYDDITWEYGLPALDDDFYDRIFEDINSEIGLAQNDSTTSKLVEGDLLRGDNPPTYSTNLPYSAVGSDVQNHVYTDRMFPPNSNGEIYTSFSGTINSGTAEVTIELYVYTPQGFRLLVDDKNIGEASGWTNRSDTWSGLNTSGYYYFQIVKTQSNKLSFTMNCT
jgi:hypothetical protein